MSEPTRIQLPTDLNTSIGLPLETRAAGATEIAKSRERSQVLTIPGYELLEEVGRGGMGIVYRARDLRLHRDVAVKVLQDRYFVGSSVADRFLEEARITSQLQHPGIPAIYQVGTLENGRPYLAMKLIHGQTLEGLLQAGPVNVLSIFEAMSHAVGYAHAHGVIHRDLKPANVMVGAFGEVQVMDWGLAKLLRTADPQATTENGRPPASIRSEDDTRTQAGSILGTPNFMSPEQANGEMEKISERSDVFGLGAVLCVMLTGKAPIESGSGEDVLLNAMECRTNFAIARLDASGAEPELVAICKRCLSCDPLDRPANANEVAEAVARLRIASEERARRALIDKATAEVQAAEQRKRRRTQLVLGLAILSTSLAGGLTAGWQWWRVTAEERKTQQALAAVTDEQTRTAAALADLTLERKNTVTALNAMTDEVVQNLLESQQKLSEPQKAFLSKIIDLYQQATANRSDSSDSRALRADGHYQVAGIQIRLHLHPEAESNYKAAIDLLESLTSEFPSVPDYQANLGRNYYRLAILASNLGRKEQAEANYRASCKVFENLIRQYPDEPTYLVELAIVLNDYGLLLHDLGRNDQAEMNYREGLMLLKRQIQKDHELVRFVRELGRMHNNLGVVYHDTSRYDLAEQEYNSALTVREGLAKLFPGVSLYRSDLAYSHFILGSLYQSTNRLKLAEVEFLACSSLRKALMTESPGVPRYRSEYANSQSNLAHVLQRLDRIDDAEELQRAVLTLRKSLVAEFPDVPNYKNELASSHTSLGVLLRESGRWKQAEPEYRAAQILQQALAREFPDVPEYLNDEAGTLVNLATIAFDKRDYATGRRLLLEAEPKHRAVLKVEPRNPTYRFYFRNNRYLLAQCLEGLRDHRSVSAIVREMVQHSNDARKDNYWAACLIAFTIGLLGDDTTLDPLQRQELTRKYGDEALNYLQAAIALGYTDHWQIRKDTDLEPLQNRADFQQLLDALTKKHPAKEPAPPPRRRFF